MGKGSGGAASAWWAFLLLASMLLVAAATAGAEEDNRRHDHEKSDLWWCKEECQLTYASYYLYDPVKVWECKRNCDNEHGNGGTDIYDGSVSGKGECRRRCMRRHENQPRQAQECMQRCEQHGRQTKVAGGRNAAAHEDNSDRGDRCQKQCQHYHDYDKKQQCVRDCRGGGRGSEAVAGVILEVV